MDFKSFNAPMIVCPYCGHSFKDSWEIEEECGELECSECGKTYLYRRIITTTYKTQKKEVSHD